MFEIFGFMTAVLGSVMFWVIYAVCTMVVGTILTKIMFPRDYNWMITGNKYYNNRYPCAVDFIIIAVVAYIGWPITLLCLMIYHIFRLFFKLCGFSFIKSVRTLDKVIPTVSIKVNKNE